MYLANIHNDRRKIYLFLREGNELKIKTDNSFFPYYFEPDPQGECRAYTGERLRKMFVSNPGDVAKNRSTKAWEADIIFTRRYAIDKIDKIDKVNIKYAFVDIEVQADELPNVKDAKYPVSCISVYNSYSKDIKTFWLPDYETEWQMLNEFINYMKQERFDLMLGWNLVDFDYPYLYNRIPDFAEKISVIGQSRYGKEDILYPAGISIVDYLGWDKKVTLNRRKSYRLDDVIKEEFGIERKKNYNFGELSEDIKNKNIEDVQWLAKLEEKKKYIDYYDEVRRLSKVEWEDLMWNSRILDMLLLQEAKNQNVVLPMKPAEDRGTLQEKAEFQGAYREAFQTGDHYDLGVYDLGSAYPSMIKDFCLDPANITENEEGLIIEGTKFKQNPNALLPTVVQKILNLKTDIKNKLSKLELDSSEYKDTKTTYDAIKSIANSAYGIFGSRYFRLYNLQVASATTFLVRSLLHYVKNQLEGFGYKVIYVDTDSVMIANNTEDISFLLNDLIKQWAKETFNKDNITLEFERQGYFKSIFIATKCRYFGHLVTDKGIEEQTKGLEIKRKDSTTWMVTFQRTLIDKILNKESKEQIFEWIRTQIKEIRNAPIQDIAFPCKLSKPVDQYKNRPIFARALEYTEGFSKKVGSPFYYIYVKPQTKRAIKTVIKVKDSNYPDIVLDENLSRKEGIEYAKKEHKQDFDSKQISVLHQKERPHDILAFDEDNNKHIKREDIDWDRIVERNILMKLQTIFEAMGWNLVEFKSKLPSKSLKIRTETGVDKAKEAKPILRPLKKNKKPNKEV